MKTQIYSDGKDYSNLKVNSHDHPEHAECVNCGSEETTILDDKDICHDCGHVYI
jgi:rRNA maturation endonuclease Nob1